MRNTINYTSDMKLELRVYAKNTHLKRLNGFSERYITKNY